MKNTIPIRLIKINEKWKKKFDKIEKYGEGLSGGYTGLWIERSLPKENKEFEPFHFTIPEELYAHFPRKGKWKVLNFKLKTVFKAENLKEIMKIFENEMKDPWFTMYGIFEEKLIFEFLNDIYLYFIFANDINSNIIFESY